MPELLDGSHRASPMYVPQPTETPYQAETAKLRERGETRFNPSGMNSGSSGASGSSQDAGEGVLNMHQFIQSRKARSGASSMGNLAFNLWQARRMGGVGQNGQSQDTEVG